jgi:hypothetical protein
MPDLKPLRYAAIIALVTIPTFASAQPAPSNEPPGANAPSIERRDDGPRWRDRDYRRDRFTDDERGERRWRGERRFGRDRDDDGDRRHWRGPRFGEGPRGGDMAGQGLMRPFGMARMCSPDGARGGEAMIARLERATQPTPEQRPAFDKLKDAAAKAGEQARAGCIAERPLTPTGRLAAAEKRLTAMLEAIRTLRPAMDAYYGGLTDEQKARLALAQPRFGGERWHRRGGDRDRTRFDPSNGGKPMNL